MPTATKTLPKPSITLNEQARRRKQVLKALNGAAAVVFAGEGSPPLLGRWQPDTNFLYLTGLASESGAAVLFDPSADDPRRRCILFLRPLNPEVDRWDGYRQQIGPQLKQRTGFETVMRSSSLPAALTAAARRCNRLACLHRLAVYPAPVSPDLAAFQEVAKRVPGVSIEDRSQLLPQLRAVKSPAELKLMNRAIDITAAGFAAAMKLIRPGITERQIADTLESDYRRQGASGLAYNTIVGAGLNATVLHYMDNSQLIQKNDLIVIDSGAAYEGYAADITRTLPASGRFTEEQREVYEVVLRAQQAAIKRIRPGAKMFEIDAAARGVIDKAGFGEAFIHGIGHQLGLEVHDVTPDGPLNAGMVITIEPGIYLPDRRIGIRIEDDLLVTNRGSRNLTAAVPKQPDEVESAMRAR